jgi:hypothetical protein
MSETACSSPGLLDLDINTLTRVLEFVAMENVYPYPSYMPSVPGWAFACSTATTCTAFYEALKECTTFKGTLRLQELPTIDTPSGACRFNNGLVRVAELSGGETVDATSLEAMLPEVVKTQRMNNETHNYFPSCDEGEGFEQLQHEPKVAITIVREKMHKPKVVLWTEFNNEVPGLTPGGTTMLIGIKSGVEIELWRFARIFCLRDVRYQFFNLPEQLNRTQINGTQSKKHSRAWRSSNKPTEFNLHEECALSVPLCNSERSVLTANTNRLWLLPKNGARPTSYQLSTGVELQWTLLETQRATDHDDLVDMFEDAWPFADQEWRCLDLHQKILLDKIEFQEDTLVVSREVQARLERDGKSLPEAPARVRISRLSVLAGYCAPNTVLALPDKGMRIQTAAHVMRAMPKDISIHGLPDERSKMSELKRYYEAQMRNTAVCAGQSAVVAWQPPADGRDSTLRRKSARPAADEANKRARLDAQEDLHTDAVGRMNPVFAEDGKRGVRQRREDDGGLVDDRFNDSDDSRQDLDSDDAGSNYSEDGSGGDDEGMGEDELVPSDDDEDDEDGAAPPAPPAWRQSPVLPATSKHKRTAAASRGIVKEAWKRSGSKRTRSKQPKPPKQPKQPKERKVGLMDRRQWWARESGVHKRLGSPIDLDPPVPTRTASAPATTGATGSSSGARISNANGKAPMTAEHFASVWAASMQHASDAASDSDDD